MIKRDVFMRFFNPKSKIENPKLDAFTLIELLVVIAIIAVLIAVLLPALSKSRHMARNVLCQARIRDVGGAMMQYAIDNSGKFPPFCTGDINNPWVYQAGRGYVELYWFNFLAENKYLPGPRGAQTAAPAVDWREGLKVGPYFQCPSVTEDQISVNIGGGGLGIAMDSVIWPAVYGGSVMPLRNPDSLVAPSQTWLVTDVGRGPVTDMGDMYVYPTADYTFCTSWPVPGDAWLVQMQTNTFPVPACRHPGYRANVFFADMHITGLTWKTIYAVRSSSDIFPK
jgi:prepilin-type N-terminal cleavage/methylation domain-containing protein/prepilin-type processing-associated H-X9-DG protein